MKTLPINSTHFRYVERGFEEWLITLGYAQTTICNLPSHVRELLYWLEEKGKSELHDITRDEIRQYYFTHLRTRPNIRRGGGLSAEHLNKHLQGLYRFTDYLRQSGRLIIPALKIPMEEIDKDNVTVLVPEEIKQVYDACDNHPAQTERKPQWFYPALALRDKAMLTAFYSCGLRRNEAFHLNKEDILLEKEVLHVRKGKRYKERFVPISKAGIKHFEKYIYDSRPLILHNSKEEALFISERKTRMTGQMMLLRLQALIERTENQELKEKETGLHTLRHSIATHLLANGMEIEQIKEFLGHSSLESTQIYTHLLEEIKNGNNYHD
jgi:integrase/recombinase XerD